jgi:predicted permease
MKFVRASFSRWRTLLGRERLDCELSEELASHLEMHIADNVRAGMTQEEARRDALIKLGGIEQTKVDYRAQRGWPFLEAVSQDVRFGLRMLRHSWGLALVVTVTLALGIGVNTAIFSVLNGWLLRPLPVRMPEQIVVLASQQKDRSDPQFSYPALVDFRKQGGAFSDLFAYALGVGGLSANGQAGEFAYSSVTGNYFSALGVKPALGRLFLADEDEKPGSELLVVLGYSYWQKRFGGDPQFVGQQVRVNGKPAIVVGIAPKEFHGTLFSFDMDGYLPLSTITEGQDSKRFWTDRNIRRLNVLGRLRPGVSILQAQSSVDVIARRLSAQYPESDQGVAVRLIPERMARPAPFVSSFVPAIASLFLFLASLVLLLACMNVANVLLARASSRRQEMAIRTALGASRSRLIRQMVTESLLLAILGGITGVALGEWAMSVSGSLLRSATTTSNFAYKLDYSFDWRVFAYTMGIAFFTAIVVGVWPAIRAGDTELNPVLHEGRGDSVGAGGEGTRRVLMVAQIAGSLTLLVVAGLFVRSFQRAETMDLGFDPDHVLSVMLDPHQIGYDEARTKAFYRDLEERVRAIPGVQSASLSFAAPLQYPGHSRPIYVAGHPLAVGQHATMISFNSVDSAYFEVMRVPLLSGRPFSESDSETSRPVAIVNQAMAERLWSNEDSIGKRFSLISPAGPFIEVVGIAGDGQYFFISPEPQPYFYVPLAQNYSSFQSLQVRSAVPPEEISTPVQAQIRALAPDLPTIDVSSMQRVVQGLAGFFVFRLAASLAATLGMLGLTLAVVGLYGVVAFGVTRRTREIGVRMALGASRDQILKLVLGQGMKLTIAGVAAGLLVALLLTRAIARLLVGVSAADPATYLAVATLLSGVTLPACWIPARRATRVDPMIALRYE